jgi:hypothetical protein
MQPANLLHITTLTEGWRDNDNVLLHACFQLLADFVEKELPESRWVNWQQDEHHAAAKKEIDALYAWWKDWQKKPATRSFDEDHEDYEKENEMLIRLINVRMYMWT